MAFSCSGMKQDLQNLREEIKQLGREIRSQLKGELLGPHTYPRGPAQLLAYLGSMWPREASDVSRSHSRPRPRIPFFIVLSTTRVCLSSSSICKETIYSYNSCCPMCILWTGRWGFLKRPLHTCGNSLMYCKEKYTFSRQRLGISHL